MVVADTVFVFHHLPVQFVDQVIDCGIQVMVCALREHIVAFDMDVALSSLATFFFGLVLDAQQHFDIHHLVEMTRYSV
jgi:hypothetical protein